MTELVARMVIDLARRDGVPEQAIMLRYGIEDQ